MLNKTDVEKASKEQIVILTKEDTAELLKMARETAQVQRVQEYIVAKIPHQIPSGPFGTGI